MMFNFFKKSDIDFEFTEIADGVVYPHYPPILAKDLKPLKDYQEKVYGEYKFPGCPGMHDYSRLGYIIPAWSNFHIKANKAGTFMCVGSLGIDKERRQIESIRQPQPMAKDITDGLFEMKDGIKHEIFNFPSPWKIYSKKNVSFLIMPAFFHSKFLDDLYVYPGVVDYNGFNTMNFICAPKRACEIEITAGDPVLHVIPFITDKEIVASYGPATKFQKDAYRIVKWFNSKNFYRRFYMIRKKYKIKKGFEE